MTEQERKFERVRPEVLQTILMDEVAARLGDLHALISQTIPQGVAESTIISLSGTGTQQLRPMSPWFNISVYNYATSANSIFVMVNKSNADAHKVQPDETYDVNMGAAKIEAIYLKVENGGSATVKVSAVR